MVSKSAGRYRLLIFAAALLFSTGGVAIKSASLNGWQIASFRSAAAALVLFALGPQARSRVTWHLLPVACAYAGTLVSFVLATRLGTAAGAIFLQSAAPVYMAILSPLILKERIQRRDLVVFAASRQGWQCCSGRDLAPVAPVMWRA